jgi:transcriptional regulator with XRE-family HTH domain
MRQCDIARPLGVTDTAVAFWELGRLRPLDEHLRAWAGLLDVPVPAGVEGGGRAVAQCGTRSGYGRHLRLREPPCDGCRAANARHQRDRKALR